MDTVCSWLNEEQQKAIIKFAEQTAFKPAPRWLGTFYFKCYYNQTYRELPIAPIIEHMAALIPSQTFNTVFLQKYPLHSEVFEHRDPKNNVGYTIIGIAGDFHGATTYQNQKEAGILKAGDVGILPCTIAGIQGPRHHVSPITSGTRYALILNTIQ